MAEASNTIDHLVFKSKSITRTMCIDFAGRERTSELGVEKFMIFKRGREFQQILHS